LLRGSADPMNPKALRAAMGRRSGTPSCSSTMGRSSPGRGPPHHVVGGRGGRRAALPRARYQDVPEELIAVIVGNEGAGIRPQLNAIAASASRFHWRAVPESLNVAVAAGILLYEVLRGH